MKEPTLKYEVRDRVRLMYVADDFMVWMTCLAFAYKMTGDRKYFDAAWKQIEAVSNMPDWNPVHHIDVGIMALGYAISYDWFYELLTDKQRELMEKCVHNNLFWIINEAHKTHAIRFQLCLLLLLFDVLPASVWLQHDSCL